MGAKTRDQLVEQGLLKQGRIDITDHANTMLQLWLDKAYDSYLWPFLTRIGYGTMAVGETGQLWGVGAGGVVERIRSIEWVKAADPTANTGYKGDVALLNPGDLHPDHVPGWLDTASLAVPLQAVVMPSTYIEGQWELQWATLPDRAYRTAVKYRFTPLPLLGSTRPLYPNDETLVQAVFSIACTYDSDERMADAKTDLHAMLATDMTRYGRASGQPGALPLAAHRFPRR